MQLDLAQNKIMNITSIHTHQIHVNYISIYHLHTLLQRCINAIWHCCFMLKSALTRNGGSMHNIYFLGERVYIPFLVTGFQAFQHSRQHCTSLQITVICNMMECSCLYSHSKTFQLWEIILWWSAQVYIAICSNNF